MGPIQVHELPPAYEHMLGIRPDQGGAVWLGQISQGAPPRIGMHHRHRELEANLILAGTGAYLMDGRRFPLEPGMLVWLPAGLDHCLVERSQDWRMHIAVWEPGVVASVASASAVTGQPLPEPRRLPRQEARLLADLMADLASRPDDPGHRLGCTWLLHRLGLAWSAAPSAARALPLHPAVARAARLLAADGDLSTAALARHLGLSDERLTRQFKRDMGLGLPDYRNRRRLDRVLDAWGPGKSLMTLALAAGFGSYAQFHRVFVAHLGTSPRDWVAQQEGRRDRA